MSSAAISSVFADTLYDGASPIARRGVLIRFERGKIVSLDDGTDPENLPDGTVKTALATPGLIDLQINGAGDVQFNFDMSINGLEQMVAASARGGAAYIFPTFTTAPGTDYQKAVEAVISAQQHGVVGIAGIHLEGPFISTARPGIHQPAFIRPLTVDDVDYLCAAAKDLKIILTLAPEHQDPALLKRLSDGGIVLFTGHSNATIDDMKAAAKAGAMGATHLFNAMSQTTGRQPDVVGAVLGEPGFYAGIIADGYHVHPTNLRLAARAMPEHLCLVTDAMQTMNGTSTSFALYGTTISLQNGKLTGADGTLGGAHLTMAEAIGNMVKLTGIGLGEAVNMASHNPAKAVWLDGKLGQLAPGLAASLSLFSIALTCIGVVQDGVYSDLA